MIWGHPSKRGGGADAGSSRRLVAAYYYGLPNANRRACLLVHGYEFLTRPPNRGSGLARYGCQSGLAPFRAPAEVPGEDVYDRR